MRFIDNKNSTITDTRTWLMWEKEGSKEPMSFEEAKHQTKNFESHFGYADWRLPTVQELISLVDYETHPAIYKNVFDCQIAELWKLLLQKIIQRYYKSIRNGLEV